MREEKQGDRDHGCCSIYACAIKKVDIAKQNLTGKIPCSRFGWAKQAAANSKVHLNPFFAVQGVYGVLGGEEGANYYSAFLKEGKKV